MQVGSQVHLVGIVQVVRIVERLVEGKHRLGQTERRLAVHRTLEQQVVSFNDCELSCNERRRGVGLL